MSSLALLEIRRTVRPSPPGLVPTASPSNDGVKSASAAIIETPALSKPDNRVRHRCARVTPFVRTRAKFRVNSAELSGLVNPAGPASGIPKKRGVTGPDC